MIFLERAQIRSLEQKSSVYNFKQLQANVNKLWPPYLDHTTYIRPVEIIRTKFKGRGLFFTKAVKAGDLLLCEKTFCHTHIGESAGGDTTSLKICLLINSETGQRVIGTQADLIKHIV